GSGKVDAVAALKGTTSVRSVSGNVPVLFQLEQNYPNPFNPSTTLGFTLQVSGLTTLKIYDALGREVSTLANENLEAGVYHERTFNASNLSSGIYFARLVSGNNSQIKKLSLIK
ncbi:MAG: T9SS type A sorting domain-containing protein, partial [Bacteroidota bacterium]